MIVKQTNNLKSRVKEHLEHIVEQIGARVVGSAENDRTRSYIAAEIEKLGFNHYLYQTSTIIRQPVRWDCVLQSKFGSEAISILPGIGTLPANLSGIQVMPHIYQAKEDFESNPPVEGSMVLVKLGTLHEADACRLAKPAAAVCWFRQGHQGLYSGNCNRTTSDPLVPGFAVAYEDTQKMLAPGTVLNLEIQVAEHPTNISSLVVDVGDVAGHPCFITHYDSRRCSPGANDNATGVVCLLVILSIWPRENPARFIFFDGEEVGAIGSDHYVRWLMAENKLAEISCIINPDSVGLNELHLYTGDRFGKLSEKMITCARQAFNSANWNVPERVARSGYSDYANFHKVGIPCLFLSDFPNEVRHTTIDDLSRIDPDVLVRLANVLADKEFYSKLRLLRQ